MAMMKTYGLILLLATGLLAAAPTAKQPQSSSYIAGLLRDAGYKAEIGKDNSGDPKISTKINGITTSIYFFNCDAGQCGSFQFYAGFDKTVALTAVNDWNKNKRYARSYIPDDGGIALEYDVDLTGVSDKTVNASIERWEALTTAFKDHINW